MKNTIKAITLTAVLAFGSNLALADGIIIGDRSEKGCSVAQTEGIIIGDREGIIIGDRTSGVVAGVLFTLEGIIIGDRAETMKDDCNSATTSRRDGIIIGDREGIIIGD